MFTNDSSTTSESEGSRRSPGGLKASSKVVQPISFNGTTLTNFPTPAGIPQGSPLSPSLYIYYKGDLLDIPYSIHTDHLALGFIDDIGYGVRGRTAESNTVKLEVILAKAEIWRQKHGAQFEKTKYVLMHFTRNRNINTEAAICIEWTLIPPLQRRKIPWSNLRSRSKIPCTHKPSSQERHSIRASNWKHRKGNMGSAIPLFTTSLRRLIY